MRRAPLFAFGAAAAWFCHRYGERVRARAAATAWVWCGGADVALLGVFVCLGLLLQWVTLITYAGAELRWPVWHLFEGGLWTLVLLLLLLAPLRSKRLLSNRCWSAVGLLSYSIYLIHDPLIVFSLSAVRQVYPSKFNAWGLAGIMLMLLVAALCLAMSAVTYWMIERPFLQRKVRISWWSVAEAPAPIPVQAQGGT
jgi:peptidoglycan/LPS O-acetylase OafA/YrhL